MVRRLMRRINRNRKGTALVEFALVLPLLLLLVFGIIEFGRVFYSWVTITHGAREGARYAAVGHTQAEIIQRAKDASFQDATVTVTNAQGTPGTTVTVTVRYSVDIVTPIISAFFPQNPVPLTSTADMRLE